MQNEFISQEAYQVARDLRCSVYTILSAPDLLDALKLLIDGIGRQDEFKSYSIEDGLAKARIAIAKAEGK